MVPIFEQKLVCTKTNKILTVCDARNLQIVYHYERECTRYGSTAQQRLAVAGPISSSCEFRQQVAGSLPTVYRSTTHTGAKALLKP